MLSDKMLAALNDQLNAEFFAAYQYLALCAYFEDRSLRGFAHWMRVQYEEELMHADKLFDYITRRDGRIVLKAIGEPVAVVDSVRAAFDFALKNERDLSTKIYNLMDLALTSHDHATHTFLQWFVTEQVEEEELIRDIVQDLDLVKDSRDGLFMMDRDLAKRQSGPEGPATEAE